MTSYADLHVLNDRGFVDADPQHLADLAGVYLDVYALASCMRSEEAGSAAGEVAIGCAVRNACAGGQLSVAQRLLRSQLHGVVQASNGHFGRQECAGKWACTRLPPTAFCLENAAKILAAPSEIEDVTQGATQWEGFKAQDAKHLSDPAKYPKSAADLYAGHVADGQRCVMVPGVPNTRFWTRAKP